MTAVEAAVVFAVVFGALAVTIPSCIRAVRLTRTAEAADNLALIIASASRTRNESPRTPLASAPPTPESVPRGQAVTDRLGTWDHPTWKTLGFSIEEPHWYVYQLDVDPDAQTTFRAIAHGDLNGNGVFSTFERAAAREGSLVVPKAGLVVTSDLE
ncbi:MAG: hypothetical protein NVS3B20_24380 [Polyangiales bacterium]